MPAPKTLLHEIRRWRGTLACEVTGQGPLHSAELNQSVDNLLNALLFFRLSELRGISFPTSLAALLDQEKLAPPLLESMREAEDRLGLRFGKISPEMAACSSIRNILRRLTDPVFLSNADCSAETLGRVYERFLGTDALPVGPCGGKALRKAGGVFYTPSPVIEYLVENTLGPALQGRSPRSSKHIRILDPACGGGAFLLKALDYLFDWHLQWYLSHGPEAWAKRREAPIIGGEQGWQLTHAERARIAQRHIYGVDLDKGAVQVTRRALVLKVCEGLAGGAVPFGFLQNIRRGNALIETDFFVADHDAFPESDELQRNRLGTFDWESEFPTIMAAGGFDVVIGNPPYANYSSRDSLKAKYKREGRIAELEMLRLTRAYCARKFPECSSGCHDLYKWFTARGLQLTKKGGWFAYILPNTWLTQSKYSDLKSHISGVCGDLTLIDLGGNVFSVVVPTCLLLGRKERGQLKRYADLKPVRDKWAALRSCDFEPIGRSGQRTVLPLIRKFFDEWPVGFKMEAWMTLREGLHIPRRMLTPGLQTQLHPVIDSKNIGRYRFSWQPQFSYANAPGKGAFKLSQGRRIVVRKTGDRLVAMLSPEEPSFVLQSLYQSRSLAQGVAPEYLLGLLNSKFLTFLYQRSEFGQKGRPMAQFRKGHLDKLPVPQLDLKRVAHRRKHDLLVEMVQERLGGNLEIESQIDALVYELFGLTEQEIELVSGESEKSTRLP